MSLTSVYRLRRHLVRTQNGTERSGKTLLVHMKRPFRGTVKLREWGSDLATFQEIVAAEIYESVVSDLSGIQTVIDLGANIGLASLYFAHHWPSCRILAVEPNPETYKILESNLAPLIRSGRCRTLQAAVWNVRAVLPFAQQPGRFSGFSAQHVVGVDCDRTEVECQNMEDIIKYSGFKDIDFLKVDVEGAEVQLFAGDVGWLSQVDNIAIEFHGSSRKISKFDELTATYGFCSRSEGCHTVLVSKKD